jgi:cytochrome P450
MLGIPQHEHARFMAWSDTMLAGSFAPLTLHGINLVSRTSKATVAMRRNLDPLITLRRRHPGDDLISMMTHADGDDGLTDDEIFWFVAMLIGAGNETTRNLLSGLLLTLAQRPDVYAQLREHPELIPAAIEEQLRFVSPIQGFYRTATRDYTIGASTIPAGARVLLLFGAANRDPRHYDDPDTFDLNRNPSDHLAFGFGIHYCLGTHLTRLEVSRVLTQLLPRVEAIHLDGDYRYLDNATMRGLVHLPLQLVPIKSGA